MTKKQKALAKYLEIKPSELETSRYDDDTFELGSHEYLVLTDDEADQKASDCIKDMAWAFRPEFLASHMTDVDASDLKPIQEKCESANPIILKLIDDVDHFVSDAVSSDGRGHFLSHYDGEEIELSKGLFAYRLN